MRKRECVREQMELQSRGKTRKDEFVLEILCAYGGSIYLVEQNPPPISRAIRSALGQRERVMA